MAYDAPYAWAVVCKDKRFHRHQNLYFGRKIALGETDAFSSPPPCRDPLPYAVIGAERSIPTSPKSCLRIELDFPKGLKPHFFFV
jgi:hypothetical protein